MSARIAARIAAVLGLALAMSGCGPAVPLLTPEEAKTLFADLLRADEDAARIRIVLPPARVNAAWTQTHARADHAPGHLSLAGDQALGLTQVWDVPIGRGETLDRLAVAQPLVVDGVLVAMDATGSVGAVDAASGAPLWRVSLVPPREDSRAGLGGGLAWLDNRLYAATGFGSVFALNIKDGSEIWRVDTGESFLAGPLAVGNRIILTSRGHRTLALAADDGQVVWIHETLAPALAGVAAAHAPAFARGVVFVPYASGELHALRLDNGEGLWSAPVGADLDAIVPQQEILQDREANIQRAAADALVEGLSSPVVAGGRVYVQSWGGGLTAIDPRTGAVLWSARALGIAAPWVVGETIYATTRRGQLVAVNAADGRILWVTQLDLFTITREGYERQVVWRGPVVAGGRVFLASSTGRLVAFDPRKGEIVWEGTMASGASATPIVVDGALITLMRSGRVALWR